LDRFLSRKFSTEPSRIAARIYEQAATEASWIVLAADAGSVAYYVRERLRTKHP
jgi:hypothetical protein